MTMSVVGYREALAGSIALQLPRGRQARIVSIAGLIILKFIAQVHPLVRAPSRGTR
jgi:hypothetical protein